jgi:hypothetical protein
VLAAPQYANGLTAAGLTAAYNAVDDVGGGAFAPTDLGASLLAWWKADSLALANAAPVTSWTDSSGNARTLTQATGANQPVFSTAQVNGLPAVTFDGTNDYLATAAFASPTSGASVFAVQKLTAANQYRTVLSHAAAATWVSPFARVLLRVTDDASGDRWQWIVEDAGVAGNAIVSAAATTASVADRRRPLRPGQPGHRRRRCGRGDAGPDRCADVEHAARLRRRGHEPRRQLLRADHRARLLLEPERHAARPGPVVPPEQNRSLTDPLP